MQPITALLQGPVTASRLAQMRALYDTGLVAGVVLLLPPAEVLDHIPVPYSAINSAHPRSSSILEGLLRALPTPWLVEVEEGTEVIPGALARMMEVARSAGASLVYGDYQDEGPAGTRPHPLADYQEGSLGEGFDMGPLRMWSVATARDAVQRFGPPASNLLWTAWYDLRLKAAAEAPVVHIPEVLATLRQDDQRATGAKVFDYLTAAKLLQVEAEQVVTSHLEQIGALVEGPPLPFVSLHPFPVEASVIIPVRNREQTILDAARSALDQVTDFPFNVVVIDNHSTDRTGELLLALAEEDPRLVYLRPERRDLGIGGCWNEGVRDPRTGRYAVQLDSDDLYAAPDVLQRIVDALRDDQCGMVIGSYETVNFDLQPIAPGLIDHREWTDKNGPNNALRVNGFGAPRAFATELVRTHPFPNVSYGEDYAVALRISREYRVGRIYQSLYHCRRWEDNTDADLAPEVVARHQLFKDRIRSLELSARRRSNPQDGGVA
ncbi:MAG: glycosyltransferase family 2 protein [Deltaproteobacteria bacterium]|nr:glycosyltransferase family 2 protein [Deltaproteobacteria bacterium]